MTNHFYKENQRLIQIMVRGHVEENFDRGFEERREIEVAALGRIRRILAENKVTGPFTISIVKNGKFQKGVMLGAPDAGAPIIVICERGIALQQMDEET